MGLGGLPRVGAYAEVQNLPGFKSAISQVNSGLHDASAASDRLAASSGGLHGAMSSLANVAMSAVTAAAAAAAAALAGLAAATAGMVIEGIKTNASLEQLQIKLDTVTGNGKEMLAWVREMSKATPFTAETLGNVIALAGAYGFGAEEAKKLALTAGDVSAAMGGGAETMNRIIRALGQMKARTKVSAGEMLQLTEAGIPAWQLLADAMHISVAELQDMVSKGLVPADGAIEVLTKGLNTKFGGAMEKQSKTAKGLWDTFTETIQLMSADITAPAFDMVKELLVEITTLAESEGFKNFVADATAEVARLSKALQPILVSFIRRIPDMARGIASSIKAVVKAFNQVRGAIKAIVDLVVRGDLGGEFYKAFGTGDVALELATAVMNIRDAVIKVVEVVKAQLPKFIALWERIRPVVEAAGKAIIGGFVNKVQHVVDLVTAIISGDWAKAWDGFKQIILDRLGLALSALDTLFPGAKDKITGLVDDLFAGIAGAFTGKGIKLGGLDISSVFEGVKNFIEGGGIQNAIDRMMSKLSQGFGSVQDMAAPFLSFFERLGAWFEEHGPGIAASGEKLFGSIAVSLGRLAGDIVPWLVAQLDVFMTWLEENGPLIESFVAKVTEVTAVVIDQVSRLWPVIQPILDLIINSILSSLTFLMQVVTGDWAGAWETVKTTFMESLNFLMEAFLAFATWVIGWFGMTGEQFTAIWQNNWNMLVTIVNLVLGNITGFVQNAINSIGAFIRDGLEAIASFWDGIWNAIWFVLRTLWVNILATIRQGVEEFRRIIEDRLKGVSKFFEDTFNKVYNAIKPVLDALQTFWNVLNDIWTWVQDHALNFQIQWPDVPDWLIPGSPTPFEMGLRGIRDVLDEISDSAIPKLNTAMAGVSAGSTYRQPAFVPVVTPSPKVVVQGGSTSSTTNYNVNANYQQTQTPRSVRDDLEMLRLMKRGR